MRFERKVERMIDFVRELQPIGYGGQPVREVFRSVQPAQSVLLDLTTLFPRQPHSRGRYHPFGLQMRKVVEARLTKWAVCEQGEWWGLVTYPITYGPRSADVTHWVPAWVLKPKPP